MRKKHCIIEYGNENYPTWTMTATRENIEIPINKRKQEKKRKEDATYNKRVEVICLSRYLLTSFRPRGPKSPCSEGQIPRHKQLAHRDKLIS